MRFVSSPPDHVFSRTLRTQPWIYTLGHSREALVVTFSGLGHDRTNIESFLRDVPKRLAPRIPYLASNIPPIVVPIDLRSGQNVVLQKLVDRVFRDQDPFGVVVAMVLRFLGHIELSEARR